MQKLSVLECLPCRLDEMKLTISFLKVYLVVQMRKMTFNTGRIKDEKSKKLHCHAQDKIVAPVKKRDNLQSTKLLLKNPNLIARRLILN